MIHHLIKLKKRFISMEIIEQQFQLNLQKTHKKKYYSSIQTLITLLNYSEHLIRFQYIQ